MLDNSATDFKINDGLERDNDCFHVDVDLMLLRIYKIYKADGCTGWLNKECGEDIINSREASEVWDEKHDYRYSLTIELVRDNLQLEAHSISVSKRLFHSRIPALRRNLCDTVCIYVDIWL